MPKLTEQYQNVTAKIKEVEQTWIQELQERGIRAAHPDDGWVNRNANEVHMVYPYFDCGLEVGSLVALGWPWKFRLVKITGVRRSLLGQIWWSYADVIPVG